MSLQFFCFEIQLPESTGIPCILSCAGLILSRCIHWLDVSSSSFIIILMIIKIVFVILPMEKSLWFKNVPPIPPTVLGISAPEKKVLIVAKLMNEWICMYGKVRIILVEGWEIEIFFCKASSRILNHSPRIVKEKLPTRLSIYFISVSRVSQGPWRHEENTIKLHSLF